VILRNRAAVLFFALLVTLTAHVRGAEVGAIVMHGKWGSPERNVDALAVTLERAGFAVSVPEMPWSGRRLYDRPVETAIADTDAEVARMRNAGVKHVFVIGHSLGAAFALYYATRSIVSGIVAIAPGHRPESPGFAKLLANEVAKAKELVASGKGDEPLWFNDPNTGGRRKPLRASATIFLSYFDAAGPMNMARNVASIKPDIPVLWLVPTREEQPARDFVIKLSKALPPNAGTRFAEPEADHLSAPNAASGIIVEWIQGIVAKGPTPSGEDKR
jgi:pimeloyl-ACP methyl ester carboxylesterase